MKNLPRLNWKGRTNLSSNSSLKKTCWRLQSRLIRIRNADWRGLVKCYTCLVIKHWKEMDCGHYIHKDCFNHEEDLLRVQCTHCNRHLSGNLGVYAENLLKEHGEKKFKELSDQRFTKKDYTRKELLEIRKKLLAELKKYENT